MLNDFLPAIVSVDILAAFFLYAWISDIRRIRHFNAAKTRANEASVHDRW
jgi:hypothetical protein